MKGSGKTFFNYLKLTLAFFNWDVISGLETNYPHERKRSPQNRCCREIFVLYCLSLLQMCIPFWYHNLEMVTSRSLDLLQSQDRITGMFEMLWETSIWNIWHRWVFSNLPFIISCFVALSLATETLYKALTISTSKTNNRCKYPPTTRQRCGSKDYFPSPFFISFGNVKPTSISPFVFPFYFILNISFS